MKTLIYLIITCFISTGALLGGLQAKNPLPNFLVAFSIWSLFVWGCVRRAREKVKKRSREQMFEEYMRSNYRNRHP